MLKHFASHKIFAIIFTCLLYLPSSLLAAEANMEATNKYVGVDACMDCHEDIVTIYKSTSKKAHSDISVKKMREKLTDDEYKECLKCHTTGYGMPSGFVSFEETPELAVVGCESCHGMGYLHTIEASKETISRTPNLELCVKCHDDSKVQRISYDGRIHAGGH